MARLAVRVDAGDRIGAGHLMRCLALAHAWGGAPTVLMAAPDARAVAAGARVERIDATPGSEQDARATAAAAAAAEAEWIVVDGYQFGIAYHQALQACGLHTVCIDDNGEAGEYAADVVLNQNLHATADLYARRAPHTLLLLGPEYVLMRPEFADAPAAPRTTRPIADRVLVTLGGGTAERTLKTILDGLSGSGVRHLQVTVLTGASCTPAIVDAAARVPGRVELLERTDRMRELMAEADLAISAGGSTMWELAFTGLPSAVTVVAPNQANAAAACVERGIAVPLGAVEDLQAVHVAERVGSLARDAGARARMSAAGQALIDGRGAWRAVAAILARTRPGRTRPAGGAA